MTEKSAPAPTTARGKVETGYGRLDEALQGGFLTGSMVVLNAPASDEVPILLRGFLQVVSAESLLICRTLSSAELVTRDSARGVKALVCSDKPIPPSKDMIPGKGIDNLTEVNLQITDALNSVQPKRLVLDILSDVLLRHKGVQTRRWLTELLERLRSKSVTTLAVLNPYMHSSEDVQAVVDVFDGNLEIIEKDIEGSLRKFVRIKWIHGVEVAEKEFPLVDLAPEPQIIAQPVTVQTPALKEPRWRTPLISRKEELTKLTTAFEDALRNRSTIVALRGEAGVGKTRLMQELSVYAQSKGGVVLFGRASGDGLPYTPWIEIARQYVSQSPGELLRRMLGTNASELVKLVPDLAAKLDTIPPPRSGSDQQNKNQFYEAVTKFFITIANQTPLLMLFDDMQNADAPSLELLEYLVRRTSDLHILTVCSTIPGADPASPLEQTLLRLNKERLLEDVQVELLGKNETTSLIKETFGEQTVTPEFADLIYENTKGNPFFVEEVLRSLVSNGTIFRTERGWDRKPIQDIKLPASLKTALKSRLTKLDAQALSALQWAAIIGPVFDFEVLREASGATEDTLLGLLETAINQGLVLEFPNEPGKLGFQDERIRELLFEDVIQLKQRRYHQKIAEAIEKFYAASPESHSEAMASHFELAGDKERTIKYSSMAGDWNRSIHAYEQAIINYKRTLGRLESGESKERASILERLGESYDRAGRFQSSLETYQEALALLQKLQEHAACARISTKLELPLYRVKGIEEAVRFLKDATKYVQENPESSEAASLYAAIANELGLLERYDEANNWAKRALEAGEKSRNYDAVSMALRIMGCSLLDTGRIDEGLPILERGFELAKKHNLYHQTWSGLLCLAGYTYPRDLSRARDYASQNVNLAKQENSLYDQASARVELAFYDWLHGEWEAALRDFQEAFEVKNRLGFKFTSLNAEAERAQFHLSLGELDKAEEFCEAALARHDEQVYQIVATNLAVGKLRLEQGRLVDAKTHFESCVDAFKDYEFTTEPVWNVETLLHLTYIYAMEDQFEKARGTVDWTRRLAETLKSDVALAMSAQAEATLLLANEDGKGAEEAYLKSLALWEKAGWPYYHAKALVAYSDAIVQTDPEESKKRLLQAAEILKKLGAKRDLEKAEAKLSK